MIRRTLTILVVTCSLFPSNGVARPWIVHSDMKTRVLNTLFPLDPTQKPYFTRMVLRFSDSNSQIVVVVFPGGKDPLAKRCRDNELCARGHDPTRPGSTHLPDGC